MPYQYATVRIVPGFPLAVCRHRPAQVDDVIIHTITWQRLSLMKRNNPVYRVTQKVSHYQIFKLSKYCIKSH